MGRPPYRTIEQLVFSAAGGWVWLDAKYPHLDLLALPFRKFLNLVYVEVFTVWRDQEWQRRTEHLTPEQAQAMPRPTKEEFDVLLNPAAIADIKPGVEF